METFISLLLILILVGAIAYLVYRNNMLKKIHAELHMKDSYNDKLLSQLQTDKNNLENNYKELEQNYTHLRIDIEKYRSNETHLNEKLLTQNKLIEENKKIMAMQFENMANRIFEEKNKQFSEQSKQKLSEILSPLRSNIKDFEKLVADNFTNQAKEQFSLKNEINRIVNINEKMTTTTQNLTNALKRDTKTQGNWGEIILERLLKDAGLRENIDYITQGKGMNMKDPETLKHLKPDVVVNLPDNKHIIIDSKMSLTHYDGFINTQDPLEKQDLLKKFLHSIRMHVKDLSKINYHANDKLASPDFTIMFIPIEGAYMLAMQEDNQLYAEAWSNKIVIISATMLFATLKTISSVWRIEKQSKNAQDIAKKGGELYDKISLFLEDMHKLGSQMKKTQESYDNAMNKLQTGRGNILTKTRQLEELGTKTKRQIMHTIE